MTTVRGRSSDGAKAARPAETTGHAPAARPAPTDHAPTARPAPAEAPSQRPAPSGAPAPAAAAPTQPAVARPAKAPLPTPPPPRPASAEPAEPADDLAPEGPSPLEVAVDRTGSWLKKAAGATGATVSAAYASLTRPRPKEAPMTAIPEAPTAPPRPGQPQAAGVPGSATRPASGAVRVAGAGPRRVRLAISRVDPWSVMKLAFLLAFAAGIVLVVAVSVLWLTLDGLHVFTKINDLVRQIVGPESPINILDFVEFKKVLSVATLVAVIDVFLLTALATIGAFLYNLVAALVGGVHVTMTDE